MTDTDGTLLKLIHDTKAMSIWNRETGPLFWGVAGVPLPFYINTELMIGAVLANELLERITTIIANTADNAIRARELNDFILTAYHGSEQYQQVIKAMAAKARSAFPAGSFDVISGGERRDWLFSIPLAREIGARHIFLFKNRSSYCAEPLKFHEKVLHVADLINNAASYFDMWLPILQEIKLECIGTLCVNTRGDVGVKRLESAGYKVVAVNKIDLDFFEQSCAQNIIQRDTLDEIALFFESPPKWASHYVMERPDLFRPDGLDKKSFDRLQSFFAKDPWNLKAGHAAFFDKMRTEIDTHLNAK